MIQKSNSRTHDAANFDAAIRCVQLVIVAMISAIGLFSSRWQVQPQTVIGTQCGFIVVLYFWSAWSWWRLTDRLFDWYLFFLTAAYIFNAGHAFLDLLSLNQHGILDGEFTADTIMRTLYMVQLSLAAMHWGALASFERPSAATTKSSEGAQTSIETLTALRLVGGALLLIAFPFAAMLLKEAVDVVLSDGYFALYQQKAPTGLGAGPKVLATFLIPGVLFLLAASGESPLLRLFALSVVLGYAAINFFLGVRHEAALLLLAFIWLWDRQIGRLNLTWLLTCGAVTLFVVFPLIAATRNVSGSERVAFAYLIEQYTSLDNPAIATMHEMGGTMGTVAHTFNLVPSQHGFERGVGYAYALLTLFPNLFWEVHPTIGRQIPSTWLTWQIDPYTAEQGGGLGYSFIAEAYLNFGWLGLVPIMFFGGFIIAWTVRWADRNRRADRAATVAAAACFMVFYVRAELAVVLRGIVWYACFPYLAVQVLTLTQHALGRRPIRLDMNEISPGNVLSQASHAEGI